jgi:glyoxylase-like metal-dependent hydrolase (beta-lactamase superfamily II)
MRVHHLNTGTMCPLGERFVNGTGSPFRRARLICHVLLVELRDGLALIDGGIGLGDIAEPARLGPRWVRRVAPRLDATETAYEQVRALGFAPTDVRHVVVTHLDLDHAGCIPDFPWATVHVHDRELAAARAPTGALARRRYIPAQLPVDARVRSYGDGGESWRGFAGVTAFDDREPDLLLVPLHGHTPGHCGVAVRGEHGWLFHAGDSYFFHGQVEQSPRIPLALRYFQRQADTDRAAREHNQARVRELALGNPDVTVFCAHDAVEYDRAVARAAGQRTTMAG